MNKKQAFIIATLLVLIVCAGVLAARVNSPLYVDSSEISTKTNAQAGDKSKGDFFTESRLNRDNNRATMLPTYQTIINDPTSSKEAKDKMTAQLKSLTTNNENEQKIENALKGKGYEDSFCQIMEEKVTVYVKTKDKLTDKQTKEIKNIVLGATKIKDVEIAMKQ
ncbi:SpoIIIAH-like family protein [Clostridium sp. YIM B02515]|uniref:SpoIIIAH-like family protein n=1 Tax=Clostridium rhizosphaerae TaxID=2803861 RepID=A0ABS1TEY5_9CLOT|nr:SpoIIIAH-like family protein [Clostridium rhizosphaerae]MBL4937910.1 SpoIIIAH-like family protein [Clostridium rhizosphaerae]